MTKLQLNPDFNPSVFLHNHWQLKPVLLPQLVPGFTDLISPAELAGLACEELVESRLIEESSPGRWNLQHGPFAESVFQRLPDSHWTVLVQAVDQWIEAVANLRALFEFIPRWRIDDVMVSYAVDSGGVGPHFDHYDVFLLQGSGKRLWQVGGKVAADTQLDNQDGVGILQSFNMEQEFVLNPGDALYIPPQFAHWGRSLGASTCYSIGFRSPALSDMLEGLSDMLIASSLPSQRYTDPAPGLPSYSAQIDPAVLLNAFQSLQDAFNTPAQFARWFGCWVTQPKYPEFREPLNPPCTAQNLQRALRTGKRLRHDSSSRFAFLPATSGTSMQLFVDGESIEFPESHRDAIPLLCEPGLLIKADFSTFRGSHPVLGVLLQLLNQGSLKLH